MDEKTFKTITNAGAGSLAIGIITLVTGITTGVLLVVSGAKLLQSRRKVVI
ncbi:MAG TPA: hypothetical protein IAB84_00735 [Candidatus Choladousia intestinigallinarum]|nr:hypothetical protein [Candidatus Choladousia intestinigallinarum]